MADFTILDPVVGTANYPAGNVVSAYATYEVPDSDGPADGEDIAMFTLPKGAVLIAMVLAADDGTASLVVDVGHATTADAYMADIDASSDFVNALETGGGIPLAADTEVLMTFTGAAPAATHNYYLTAVYIVVD